MLCFKVNLRKHTSQLKGRSPLKQTKSIIDTFSEKLLSIFSPVGSHVATQVLRRPETSQAEGTNDFSVGVVWVFSLLVGMFIVVW
jgi:hypothetical protein